MSEVSLKRFYVALFDDGLTLKTDDTMHLQKKGSESVFLECYCDKALSTNTLT